MNNYFFNPQAIPLFTIGIFVILSGLFVFTKNKSSPINRSYFILCISGSIWLIATAFGYSSVNPEISRIWFKIDNYSVPFISINVYLFVSSFLRIKRTRVLLIGYIVAFIFGLITLTTDYLIIGIKKFSWGFFPQWGMLSIPILAFFFGFMVFSFIELIHQYRHTDSFTGKNQIKYIIIALLGAYTGSVDFLPTFGIEVYPFGYLSIAFFLTVIALAIITFRLIDVNLAIIRAFIFVITASFSFFLLSILFGLTREILPLILGEDWWYFSLALIMVFSGGTFYLCQLFVKQSDRVLKKKLHEAQEALEVSGRGLIEIDDIYRLAKIIPRYLTLFYYIRLRIKISHATVFLLDPTLHQYRLVSSSGEERHVRGAALLLNCPLGKWFTDKRKHILKKKIAKPQDIDVLRIDDIDYWMQNKKILSLEQNIRAFLKDLKREMENLQAIICVPSFFKGNLLGFLLLGNKSHGLYTEEELELFSHLSTNAAAAFRSAQLSELIRKFEEEKAEVDKLKGIGEMLNSLRHESGNLINKIGIDIQMMLSAHKKQKEDEFNILNQKIVQEVMSIKTLWRYIDDYRKKSASDTITSCNLRELTDQAISHSNGFIEKWKIRVFQSIDPRITVLGKETLPDIFKHLIINSCYGMENEGGEISISVKLIEDMNMAEIVQADSGQDLQDEIKHHVTMGGELFAEQGKLGGINLFLARRIINDHHGTLHIESNNGNGTRFIVRLPLDFTKVAI